ncbi:hypothetical protein MBLNU459_g1406t1 [Dothideomycetes sp. NU459]
MEPWQSWAIVVIGGAVAYYYYIHQQKPKANRTRTASVSSDSALPQPKPARRREDTKAKPRSEVPSAAGANVPQLNVHAGDESAGTSGTEPTRKRKGGKKLPVSALVDTAVPGKRQQLKRPEVDESAQDEDDNKAWAQQLASLKKGTTLAPPAQSNSRSKTVKQSATSRNQTLSSSASSTAADADDDLTPAMSPSLRAGDVSDMLEPTPAAPSVLRLTESSKPAQTKQPRQQNAFQVQETKKQRQNRQKVEERKLQREAEEKERQALLEKQRRTAREARGEPAKNGVPASKPPAVSAWAAQAAARATAPPVVESHGSDAPLFDTFDRDAAHTNGAAPKEQSEDDSGWSTVPKGKKQKSKGAVAGSGESNGSEDGYGYAAPAEKSLPPPPKPAAAAPVPKPTATQVPPSLYDSGYDAGSHPEDSQWSA